jgi:hypothetical protein
MKKLLPLVLCLLLSIFTVARATKPAHTSAPDTKTVQEESTGQEANAKPLLKEANTDEEVTSDDDETMDDPPGDEGEDMNGDDGRDTPGDQHTGNDDEGDDDGRDDGSGDEGE